MTGEPYEIVGSDHWPGACRGRKSTGYEAVDTGRKTCDRRQGYRSAFFGPLLQASRRGGLPLPPVRCAAVPFAGQVRCRVRLAEFRRRNPRCREAHDGCRRPAYRNHLCPLRRTPGTCLYGRRLYAQKYAPLRQLRLARVRTRRGSFLRGRNGRKTRGFLPGIRRPDCLAARKADAAARNPIRESRRSGVRG